MASFSAWPNQLGWASAAEFQKLWRGASSSLSQEKSGVVDEDTKLEVETIRALTTLLLQSKLAVQGNPLTTFPHLPRQREIIFLKNNLGRRLLRVRQVIEDCLMASQSPSMLHMYSQNITLAEQVAQRQLLDFETKKALQYSLSFSPSFSQSRSNGVLFSWLDLCL